MIYINDIPSFRNPESFKMIIDDRVEKIELMNGVAVQDLGQFEAGNVFSIVCMFEQKKLEQIIELWANRQKVSFTDTAGFVWQGLRIVLKELERDKDFPNCVTASFELWRK